MLDNLYEMALNMKISLLKEKIEDTEKRMFSERDKRKIAWCEGYITKCVAKIIRYEHYLKKVGFLAKYEKEVLKHELKLQLREIKRNL